MDARADRGSDNGSDLLTQLSGEQLPVTGWTSEVTSHSTSGRRENRRRSTPIFKRLARRRSSFLCKPHWLTSCCPVGPYLFTAASPSLHTTSVVAASLSTGILQIFSILQALKYTLTHKYKQVTAMDVTKVPLDDCNRMLTRWSKPRKVRGTGCYLSTSNYWVQNQKVNKRFII